MAILSDAAARAPGLKFLLVALITIAMSVPLLFVFIALVDRQDYAKTAADDIARGWGGAQVVGGPALAIPYTVSESTRTADDAITTTDVRRIAIFLPKELRGNAVTRTETRSRGIFDVNVYRGEITLDGTFLAPDFGEIGVTPKSIAWDQALLLLPISDLQGLSENVSVLWGAQKTPVPFRPGLVPELAAYSGINARVPMAANTARRFRSRSSCAARATCSSRRPARRPRSRRPARGRIRASRATSCPRRARSRATGSKPRGRCRILRGTCRKRCRRPTASS